MAMLCNNSLADPDRALLACTSPMGLNYYSKKSSGRTLVSLLRKVLDPPLNLVVNVRVQILSLLVIYFVVVLPRWI